MKDRVVFSKTEPFYYEATAAGVDKGTGLERLCNYLKIALENVMALGDQANDAPMLGICWNRCGNGECCRLH